LSVRRHPSVTLFPYATLFRSVGKWTVAGIVAVVALSRIYLGVEAPTDIAVAVVIGVAFPVIAFRTFLPNEYFPVTYKRGRSAHRSEEHTSELQSRENLVCRLL